MEGRSGAQLGQMVMQLFSAFMQMRLEQLRQHEQKANAEKAQIERKHEVTEAREHQSKLNRQQSVRLRAQNAVTENNLRNISPISKLSLYGLLARELPELPELSTDLQRLEDHLRQHDGIVLPADMRRMDADALENAIQVISQSKSVDDLPSNLRSPLGSVVGAQNRWFMENSREITSNAVSPGGADVVNSYDGPPPPEEFVYVDEFLKQQYESADYQPPLSVEEEEELTTDQEHQYRAEFEDALHNDDDEFYERDVPSLPGSSHYRQEMRDSLLVAGANTDAVAAHCVADAAFPMLDSEALVIDSEAATSSKKFSNIQTENLESTASQSAVRVPMLTKGADIYT